MKFFLSSFLLLMLAVAVSAQVSSSFTLGTRLQGTTLPVSCSDKRRLFTLTQVDGANVAGLYRCNGTNYVLVGDGTGAPTDATYITQTANATLSNEQALSTLSTGIMRVATTTGVITSLTDSAGIRANLSDELGTGALLFDGATPTSFVLTNATGLPVSTGISGLGANVATFLATPSSANLRGAVTDENGTGALLFDNATSPAFVTPNLGTPSAATLTNATGLPFSTGLTGTISTAQLGTTNTPQFARIGLGAAADATALLTGNGHINLSASSTLGWSTVNAIQTGGNGFAFSPSARSAGNYFALGNNAYFDGTNNRYTSTDLASDMSFYNGTIIFNVAPSGTAGNILTWVNPWQIVNAGHLVSPTDNTYDIGASGATRPRTGYFGTSVISPLFRSSAAKVLFQGTGTGATQMSSTQTTAPTCSSNCGTSPSVAGSDSDMLVTMGATGVPASGWVITFNGTWAAAPVCHVQMAKAGMVVGKMALTAVTTTTTLTVVTNGTAPATSDVYAVMCRGTQ